MRVLVAIAVALLAITAVPAQEPLSPKWESLFNGQDLSGWQKIGNEKWVVVDGAIYGEGVTDEYGYLATEKTYRKADQPIHSTGPSQLVAYLQRES